MTSGGLEAPSACIARLSFLIQHWTILDKAVIDFGSEILRHNLHVIVVILCHHQREKGRSVGYTSNTLTLRNSFLAGDGGAKAPNFMQVPRRLQPKVQCCSWFCASCIGR